MVYIWCLDGPHTRDMVWGVNMVGRCQTPSTYCLCPPDPTPNYSPPCSHQGRELCLGLCLLFLQFFGYCTWYLSIPATGARGRGHAHLGGPLEDAELLGIGQGGIQGKDQHGGAAVWEVLSNIPAGLAHGFDLLLPSEEHQDVLRRRGLLEKGSTALLVTVEAS